MLTLLAKVTKLCKFMFTHVLTTCLPLSHQIYSLVCLLFCCSLNACLKSSKLFPKPFFSLKNSNISNPPHSCLPWLLNRCYLLSLFSLQTFTNLSATFDHAIIAFASLPSSLSSIKLHSSKFPLPTLNTHLSSFSVLLNLAPSCF